MNTKHVLLLLLALLLTTASSSLVIKKSRMAETTETLAKTEHPQPAEPVAVPHGRPHTEHENVHQPKSPLQPEDGKHHRFHFGRIHTPVRRRPLHCLLCKVVLTIGHICCFLYCFFHVFSH